MMYFVTNSISANSSSCAAIAAIEMVRDENLSVQLPAMDQHFEVSKVAVQMVMLVPLPPEVALLRD